MRAELRIIIWTKRIHFEPVFFDGFISKIGRILIYVQLCTHSVISDVPEWNSRNEAEKYYNISMFEIECNTIGWSKWKY